MFQVDCGDCSVIAKPWRCQIASFYDSNTRNRLPLSLGIAEWKHRKAHVATADGAYSFWDTCYLKMIHTFRSDSPLPYGRVSMSVQESHSAHSTKNQISPFIIGAIGLVATSIWALWPRIVEMSEVWAENPTYSHGYLVPLFSIILLWLKRSILVTLPLEPNWWGLPIIALACAVQLLGMYIYIPWLEGASLMIFLSGIATLVGSWRLLRLTWPSIAFLVFMIPLPWRVEATLRTPLRLFAAQVSNWLLQLFGLPSVVEGTVIDISGQKLGVEEACSGIAMLMTFFALATGLMIVVQRPWVDKLVIVLSALPIAIVCNVLRITATGILYCTVGESVGKFVYHDLAGFLMMPMGIAFLWIELFILDHLFLMPKESHHLNQPVSPLVIPGISKSPFREGFGPS